MKVTELPKARRQMVSIIDDMIKEEVKQFVNAEKLVAARNRWAAADLYFVTADMTQVALEAMESMPPWKPREVMPSDTGFMWFDGGLPELPNIDLFPSNRGGSSFGGLNVSHSLPVDWVAWKLTGFQLLVEFGTTSEAFRRQVAELGVQRRDELRPMPLATMGSVGYHVANQAFGSVEETAGADDPWTGSLLMLLGAAWVLMEQPSVAEKRVELGTEATSGGRSFKVGVTTVSLRRIRQVTVDHDESGRKLTHRHYVRAHLRNQAFGTGRSQRKLIAIAPFIKGPAGAPLVQRERVTVWRR